MSKKDKKEKKEIDFDSLPEELKQNRQEIECNFVFGLYKEPERITEFSNIVNGEDILTPDGIFYYGVLQKMLQSGYNEISSMSIYTFMEEHPDLKKIYEMHGGYSTVNEIVGVASADNLDKFYDSLTKSNLLIRLYQRNFPVLSNLKTFVDMDAESVYDYYSYMLADVSVGKIEKIKVVDLSEGNDEWVEEIDKGILKGYPIDSPIINYMLAGIHPDNLTLHIAGIGQGKTTTAIILYVMSVIKNNDVTIISNEQGVNEFRAMLMSTVLFNKIGNVKGMNRQKFVTGGFSDEQKSKLHEASEWLKKQPGHVRFVEMQDYDIKNIRKIIIKQSKLGCSLFIVDTIKPVNEMDDRAWAQFSEVAKNLFLLAKQTHTAIICTAQASAESNGRKYLDLSSIAKSKAIAETATQVIGFRPIYPDEIDKIHPYMWEADEPGKEKIKRPKDLQPDKHYVMFYIMKNRFGPTMPQVVCEFDQAFCRLKEVGYYQSDYAPVRGR